MRAILRSGALIFFFSAALFTFGFAGAQTDEDQRRILADQIAALEREAVLLDSQISEIQNEAKTLQNAIKILNAEVKRRELEIKRLALAVKQADIDIRIKASGIEDLTLRIEKDRAILGRSIAAISEHDNESLVFLFAKNQSLSDFFTALDNLKDLQSQIGKLVEELRQTREELGVEKQELEDFRVEQASLKAIAEVERRGIVEKRQEKNRLLSQTKGKEAEFQKLLTQKKKDIAALKTQLFYIERTGIKAEEALHYAELAAQRTGIRTAFLLALLEVETGRQFEGGVITAGTYLGTGNWRDDMYNCYINLGRRSAAEAQKNAFFAITSKLGLDPDKMPVSRRPSYGCGGAMGPAQFIPTTWRLFESKTASLTGHNPPNPWNIEDAFTASAIFLAESGATSQAKNGELAAARTYISGRASCPPRGSARYACIAYANRVLSLSVDIDKVI